MARGGRRRNSRSSRRSARVPWERRRGSSRRSCQAQPYRGARARRPWRIRFAYSPTMRSSAMIPDPPGRVFESTRRPGLQDVEEHGTAGTRRRASAASWGRKQGARPSGRRSRRRRRGPGPSRRGAPRPRPAAHTPASGEEQPLRRRRPSPRAVGRSPQASCQAGKRPPGSRRDRSRSRSRSRSRGSSRADRTASRGGRELGRTEDPSHEVVPRGLPSTTTRANVPGSAKPSFKQDLPIHVRRLVDRCGRRAGAPVSGCAPSTSTSTVSPTRVLVLLERDPLLHAHQHDRAALPSDAVGTSSPTPCAEVPSSWEYGEHAEVVETGRRDERDEARRIPARSRRETRR